MHNFPQKTKTLDFKMQKQISPRNNKHQKA